LRVQVGHAFEESTVRIRERIPKDAGDHRAAARKRTASLALVCALPGISINFLLTASARSSRCIRPVRGAPTAARNIVDRVEPTSGAPAALLGISQQSVTQQIVFEKKLLRRAEGIRACPVVIATTPYALPGWITYVDEIHAIAVRGGIADGAVIGHAKYVPYNSKGVVWNLNPGPT
jgi:hypothetical protein